LLGKNIERSSEFWRGSQVTAGTTQIGSGQSPPVAPGSWTRVVGSV